MSGPLLETLCRITGAPGDGWREADVTIRVTRPGEVQVRWRRWQPGSGWSDERVAVGRSLLDALGEACAAEWDEGEGPNGRAAAPVSPESDRARRTP